MSRHRLPAAIGTLALLLTLLATSPSRAASCPDAPPVPAAGYGRQVDRACRDYYIERVPALAAAAAESAAPVAKSAEGVDVFTLHSRPASENILYLDFDGFDWSGQEWWDGQWGLTLAGWKSPGYNPEGDFDTFTSTERDNILAIWEAVSEDFAVFDVDVTTELPTGDRAAFFATSGAYALILSDATLQVPCACGGVAHLDVFEQGDPRLRPSLNFAKFGNDYTSPWDIAEIVAHEVGHTMGLLHDGTSTEEYYGGHAMWTPLMGAGRGAGIATWSDGGYPDALTRGAQPYEDDFATIARYLPLLPDAIGGDATSAMLLSPSPGLTMVAGRIEGPSDADWFRLTAPAGITEDWTFDIVPRGYAPNLDPELTLLDATGAVLQVSNPQVPQIRANGPAQMGLDAEIISSLAAGVYYLKVVGVGQGSLADATGYSSYASRGNYELHITMPNLPPPVPAAAFGSFAPLKARAGALITIRGQGLSAVTAVFVGGVKVAKFTKVSETRLKFRVPAKAKSAKIKLVTPDGPLVSAKRLVRLP